MNLVDIKINAVIRGIVSNQAVTVTNVSWFLTLGTSLMTVTYRTMDGNVAEATLTREDEDHLELVEQGNYKPKSYQVKCDGCSNSYPKAMMDTIDMGALHGSSAHFVIFCPRCMANLSAGMNYPG
jgi:hypothetical protein